MTNLSRFMAYAAAFEQTFADDNWQRLEPFFTPDATYRVSGLPASCELHGRDAIFRGEPCVEHTYSIARPVTR